MWAGGWIYTHPMNTPQTATPLADWHDTHNARWMELDGQPLVAGYGDAAEAHQRVRAHGGLIDRSYRGLLRVTGPDRDALLQSLATNEVEKQATDSVRANALCTNHGKVLGLYEGLKLADEWLLDMDPGCTADTAAYLEKYTIIRDAKTVDVTGQYGHVGLYGPHVATVLAEVLALDATGLPTEPESVLAIPGGWAMAATELGLDGFELLVERDQLVALWQALVDAGAPRQVMPFGFETLESLRIEAGVARFGLEATEGEILLETGLGDRASYDKGCYVGQETLSRIVFRGQVSRRLCGLVMDGSVPEVGTTITADTSPDAKELGAIRSACYSPSLDRPVALAYLKRSHWEAGSTVQVGAQTATVAELPLVS